MICSIIILLIGTSAIRKANDEFTRPQKGSEFYATRGVSGLVKDFPRAMWNLIKNIPLMCINFGIAAEFFIISCTTVFGPKYMETQFNLQASTAAVMAGECIIYIIFQFQFYFQYNFQTILI